MSSNQHSTMTHWIRSVLFAVFLPCLLAGCAAPPVLYQGLASSPWLRPNPQDAHGHLPFYYAAAGTRWASYDAVMLDPVVIYPGTDQQFGHLDASDREVLARCMQQAFAKVLARSYRLTSRPGPHVLRIHLTLTGAATTVPVLATVKQLVPVGAVLGTLKSVADKPSRMMGSVTYAVEIYGGADERLLKAFIARQYPAAENVPASLGDLAAAETGIRKGAESLPLQLQDQAVVRAGGQVAEGR
ncbi:DUF3313 domain-containing protein [Frateuria aurantia]